MGQISYLETPDRRLDDIGIETPSAAWLIFDANLKENCEKLGYKDTVQNTPYHDKTVLEHSKASVNVLREQDENDYCEISTLSMYAAMFHDIGKLATKKVNEKTGYDTFHGHAEKSAEMLKKNRYTLCPVLDDNQLDYVTELIRLHDTKYNQKSKIKKMLETHPDVFVVDLLSLQVADTMSKSNHNRLQQLENIKDYCETIRDALYDFWSYNRDKFDKTTVLDLLEGTEKWISVCIKKTKEKMLESEQSTDKVFLARTASNVPIYMDKKEFEEHMAAHADVSLAHIREAIGKMEEPGFVTIDLGHTIGKNHCVEITPEDKVEYLYRKGREGTTPMVNYREPVDTSEITIGVERKEDGRYTFVTSFYGPLTPMEPWDNKMLPGMQEASDKFWGTHALICPEEAIDRERSNALKKKEFMKKGVAKRISEAVPESSYSGTTPEHKIAQSR